VRRFAVAGLYQAAARTGRRSLAAGAHRQNYRTCRSEAEPLCKMEAILRGLESLTIAGPSQILNSLHAQALKTVSHLPAPLEREMALSQAWLASSEAVRLLEEGNRQAAAQAMQEMYSQARAAISASRPA